MAGLVAPLAADSALLADGLPESRRRWACATVVIAMGLATLDATIANTALPTIAADLETSPSASIWIITAYQLSLVSALLPLAALGERFSYRRIYGLGMLVFTLASLLCAMSSSLPMLVAARVLQGLGASGIMSVNTALIRFIYPTRLLGRGVGFNVLVVGLASMLGPSVASGILSVASWPWLFAVNVPLGLVGVVIALPTLPDNRRSASIFDVASALLNMAAFGSLIFVLGEGVHGAPPGTTVLWFVIAAAFWLLLLRRERARSTPMVPIDLFRGRVFALSAVTTACSFAAQGLAYVALPFEFQDVLGRSAVETGLLMTPWPVAVAAMAPLAGRLSDRYPPGVLAGVGLAVLGIGLATLLWLSPQPTAAEVIWRMAICGSGFGLAQSPNLKAVMASAPTERSGGASGVAATARLLGQTGGAALVALCFGVSMVDGSTLALALSIGFAAVASIISFLRALAPRDAKAVGRPAGQTSPSALGHTLAAGKR